MTTTTRSLSPLIFIVAVVITTGVKGGNNFRQGTALNSKTRGDPKERAAKGTAPIQEATISAGDAHREKELNELTNFVFRNASHEERLLAFLFRDYDPVARAVMNTDKTVVVKIDFVLLRIHGLDERSQVLTTTGLVIAEWTDARLTWNPVHFGNLTSIIVKAEKLWLPELAVMNGADELMPDFDRIRVLLHHDGRLHWEPGGIFRTTCDIDIALFPFDTQHCPLLIGAYSYHSTKMNITNASTLISTHDFRINGEWHVYATSAEWNITIISSAEGGGYPHVIFTLHLQRRCKFYIMNIILPCVMLSVLIMIGFCLPPDAGEKISLGISVLLAFTVFLLMIADTIPRTSLAIPLIVTYLMATMTLGTMSICMTVLVLNVHHRGPRCRIPGWLRRLVLVCLARVVCLETQGHVSSSSSATTCQQRSASTTRLQKIDVWKRRRRSDHPRDSSSDAGLDDVMITSCVEDSKTAQTTAFNGPKTAQTIRYIQRLAKAGAGAGAAGGAEWANAAGAGAGTAVEGPDQGHEAGDRRKGSAVEEWHELAHVLDRVFFWLLFTLMTASAVVILLYPTLTGGDES